MLENVPSASIPMITLAASLRVSCRYPLQLRNSTPVTKITFNPSICTRWVQDVVSLPATEEDVAQLLVGGKSHADGKSALIVCRLSFRCEVGEKNSSQDTDGSTLPFVLESLECEET